MGNEVGAETRQQDRAFHLRGRRLHILSARSGALQRQRFARRFHLRLRRAIGRFALVELGL